MPAESEPQWREREAREEMLTEVARQLAPQVRGLTTTAAADLAARAGLSIRYHRTSDPVTEEFVPGRLTALVEDDVVVTVSLG